MGISSEDQIHIFERFYKVDKSRDRSLGGNGLGLSLVKKLWSCKVWERGSGEKTGLSAFRRQSIQNGKFDLQFLVAFDI
ncbi:hypothetical protein DOT_5055 [Desulfosporosinus sp. OT]|nr:hypothetical protein DOT_5055 [Desulfosporosinus sp. OT]